MARNAPIDLLRGVAILLVLLLHYSLTYRLSKSPLADWFGVAAVRAVVNNGNYGVTMFFVVSGYLITSNTLRRFGSLAGIDVRAFYVMRAARILPPLLLALVVIVTLGLLGVPMFGNSDGAKNLPASYYFLAVGSVPEHLLVALGRRGLLPRLPFAVRAVAAARAGGCDVFVRDRLRPDLPPRARRRRAVFHGRLRGVFRRDRVWLSGGAAGSRRCAGPGATATSCTSSTSSCWPRCAS